MLRSARSTLIAVGLVLGGIAAAAAANTTFFTSIGDLVFPFKPPTASAPGLIDNMTIGATTPRGVNATTLTATTKPTGTGFDALQTAPGAIGSGTPNTGAFTDLTATDVQIDTGTKTATASSGAATLNKNAGVITSEALTTAAGATYTLTLTDSAIAAVDQVFASVQLGSATTGMPTVTTVTPGAGSVVVVVQNIHASAALNGTIKISFARLKN